MKNRSRTVYTYILFPDDCHFHRYFS